MHTEERASESGRAAQPGQLHGPEDGAREDAQGRAGGQAAGPRHGPDEQDAAQLHRRELRALRRDQHRAQDRHLGHGFRVCARALHLALWQMERDVVAQR